jgi:hypothetical protein
MLGGEFVKGEFGSTRCCMALPSGLGGADELVPSRPIEERRKGARSGIRHFLQVSLSLIVMLGKARPGCLVFTSW